MSCNVMYNVTLNIDYAALLRNKSTEYAVAVDSKALTKVHLVVNMVA